MHIGLDHESTTTDVLVGLGLSGRRFFVTGTSAGLGEEATRAIAAAGGSAVMLARVRRSPPARAVGPFPRRRHGARTAHANDLAAVLRPR